MSDSGELTYARSEIARPASGVGQLETQKLPFRTERKIAGEYQEQLKQLVDERTAELRETNEQLGREVAERVAAEEALQHNYEYQTTINALLQLALKQSPLEALLQRAFDMVVALPALVEMSAGAIFLVDEPGNLTLKVHKGLSPETCDSCAVVRMGHCLCGQAAETAQAGKILQVTQVKPAGSHACNDGGHHGHCCLPFSAEGEVLGVLCLLLPKDWALEEWEVRFLSGVSDALAGIIARKQADSRRAELEEQLAHSQKLEAVGRLAGGIAHDFNNLLTVIRGNVYLNLTDTELPEQTRADLESIENAATRASVMTRQLLAFGRKQVLQAQETDINAIVREVEKMLCRIIGEDVELCLDLQEGLWPTKVDPGQLEQVILNMVVNARDALPRGGQVVLETRNVTLEQQPWVHLAEPRSGPYVKIAIRDNGVGMSAETLEHMFDPYYTTKDVGEGSGLGLSTAYGVVRQSGGDIQAESVLGQGTSVVIHLPKMVADEPGPADLASQSCTVLLVEDEEGVRNLVARILRRLGHQVFVAADSDQALKLISDHAGEIELLVTDVIMPGLSGDELAERVRALKPDVKVLFMSGYTGTVLCDRGVHDEQLLQKPFTPQELNARVAAILDGKV